MTPGRHGGLPASDLRTVVEYMTAAEELRAAARAVCDAADNAPQVRIGAPDGPAQPTVPWPALERLRKAAG